MEAWTPQGYSESSAPLEHAPRGRPHLLLDLKRQARLSTGAASTSGSRLRFGVYRAILQNRRE